MLMQKVPLNYETPSTAPVRRSLLWIIVRLIIAAPFACWGVLMVLRGVGEMVDGKLHYVAQVLWGVLLIAIAVAAIRLPVHRPSA